jgi:hypothetical protein
MRLSHPYFQLYTAALHDLKPELRQRTELRDFLRKEHGFEIQKIFENPLAIALRWTQLPEWGFPRKPFKVYRRPLNLSSSRIVDHFNGSTTGIVINLRMTQTFSENAYLVAVECQPAPGQSILITPVTKAGQALKDKEVLVSESSAVIFKAPFIHGLQFNGLGRVTGLRYLRMQEALNASDWEEIQEVGFPFSKKDISAPHYDAGLQGVYPNLRQPEQAALWRLMVGAYLFQPPPAPQAVDPSYGPLNWRFPDPRNYLQLVANEQLRMIAKCLVETDDYAVNANSRQANYRIKESIEGIDQGNLGATENAEVEIPVVGQTLLATSLENPAALGLGYGTYDFIFQPDLGGMTKELFRLIPGFINQPKNTQLIMPPAAALTMDYMVSNTFSFPPPAYLESFVNMIPGLQTFSKTLEICALAEEKSAPVVPGGIKVTGMQVNRPMKRNDPFTQHVQLEWRSPAFPHGFGVIRSLERPLSESLNDSYHDYMENFFERGTFLNFHNEVILPAGDGTEEKSVIQFSESDEVLPLHGSKVHKYMVASWDVFGRWSNWTPISRMAQSPAPQIPTILAVELNIGDKFEDLTHNTREVSVELQIDFGWDWADRSPRFIEFSGDFIALSARTETHLPNGQVVNGNYPTTPRKFLRAVFDLARDRDQLPAVYLSQIRGTTLASERVDAVYFLADETPVPGDPVRDGDLGNNDAGGRDLIKYRIVLKVALEFDLTTEPGLCYQVHARGLESVRPAASGWSEWSPGKNQTVFDPRPPATVEMEEIIQFTALPDTSNTARATFQWPSVPRVSGYHLWEAHETALRSAIESAPDAAFAPKSRPELPNVTPLEDSAVGLSHSERAGLWRDILSDSKVMGICDKHFSKINKNLLTENKCEVALPGAADVLFFYRVSAVNQANVDGQKSQAVAMAVPRVVKPESPLIRAIQTQGMAADGTQVPQIEVSLYGNDNERTNGFRLYRVRKAMPGSDIGMMGLPYKLEGDLDWLEAKMTLRDGTEYEGKKIIEAPPIIQPSWRPFIYQAVAIGKDVPANGELAGVSEPSSMAEVYCTPKAPPLLRTPIMSFLQNAHCAIWAFDTNATFRRNPFGWTKVEIFENPREGTWQPKLLHAISASEALLQRVAPELPPNGTKLPKLSFGPLQLPDEKTTFYLFLPRISGTHILRLTDPLGRFTEVSLELN